MCTAFGRIDGPAVLLHGGEAGPDGPTRRWQEYALKRLADLSAEGMKLVLADHPPLAIVGSLLEALEDDDQFNAGLGGTLQLDGQARLSASVMDGPNRKFSGVSLATHTRHPSRLAVHLQQEPSRVLGPPGTDLYARRLGLDVEDPVTEARMRQWLDSRPRLHLGDTVGCVIRMKDGTLYGGISTGGGGNDFPGRISDAATIAGLYASPHAAVACTGKGEQIHDDGVALRVEARRRDGMTLHDAARRTFDEARQEKREYGFVAVDRAGDWAVCHTMKIMAYVVADPRGVVAQPLVQDM